MSQIRAAITGIGGYVPDYILNNSELSKMVETSDEWIMQRIGIKERRILKEKGKATSDLGAGAVNNLLEKTGVNPKEIECVICGTITGDLPFPATANLIACKTGLTNAFCFDINAACSGFIFSLETARRFIESGKYKKIIVIGADMMSSITDYTDRSTCPLFGDGSAAALVEPAEEGLGIFDSIVASDGSGSKYLYQKAGGSLNPASHETVDNHWHYVYQEGQTVFKFAVSKMADISVEIMRRNNIAPEQLAWFVPHQANMRIIEAVGRRMCIKPEQLMVNIQKYGNTTAATIPLCLWEFEKQLRKGDNVILTSFGAGFTWGTIYLKWAY